MTFETLEKTHRSSLNMFMHKNENYTKCFRKQMLSKHTVIISSKPSCLFSFHLLDNIKMFDALILVLNLQVPLQDYKNDNI